MPETTRKPARVSLSLIVLLIGAIGAGYWVFVIPKRVELATVNSQLVVLRQDQVSVTADVETLNKLISQLKSDTDDMAHLDESLPLVQSGFRTQMLLTKLAQFSGVTLNSISVDGNYQSVIAGNKQLLANPYAVTRKLQTSLAQITVSGSYDQLKVFLQKIENNSRIMNVQSLSLTSNKGDTLIMNLSLAAYSFAP